MDGCVFRSTECCRRYFGLGSAGVRAIGNSRRGRSRVPKSSWCRKGFNFTEGPVGAPDGGLYFTDNRANKILLLDPSGKISVTHENTTNANGLVLTKEGDILAAEGVGKRISKRSKSGGAGATLTDSFDGKPFMAPNDLFVDARGGIYFTDPGPRPVVPGRKTFVYYLAPGAKEPIVIDDQLGRPNGVILTADGKTLDGQRLAGRGVFRLRRRADRRGQEQARVCQASRHPGRARKAAPTALRSIPRAAFMSRAFQACRFSVPRAIISAPSRRRSSPATWHLPARTDACCTSPRARVFIASRRWLRGSIASPANERSLLQIIRLVPVHDLAAGRDPHARPRLDVRQRLSKYLARCGTPTRNGCRQIDMQRPVLAPSS